MSLGLRITLIAISLVLILLTGTAAYYTPRFFAYADEPVKSDAIILFVGPDITARKKEAHRLLDEGYARYLIIPAYQQVFSRFNIPPLAPIEPDNSNKAKIREYPHFYEDTHIEVLYAKRIMNSMGLRSAIMVSSHSHMRRIKIIANRVFGEQARSIAFVPTPYERAPASFRDMGWSDLKIELREYVKIAWFFSYQFISCAENYRTTADNE